jgi:hypothetical protein
MNRQSNGHVGERQGPAALRAVILSPANDLAMPPGTMTNSRVFRQSQRLSPFISTLSRVLSDKCLIFLKHHGLEMNLRQVNFVSHLFS